MNRAIRLVAAAAVTSFMLPGLASAQMEEAIDNMSLQTKVKAKLIAEEPMEGAAVNLETEDGVVQLGGFIEDEAKAKKLAELAAGVEGVKQVDNQLHLKSGDRTSGQAVDDGVITTKVKAGLAEADIGVSADINIDTYNGVVLLTGFVDSKEIKNMAEKYASEQENVKKVINGIHVRD